VGVTKGVELVKIWSVTEIGEGGIIRLAVHRGQSEGTTGRLKRDDKCR